MENPKLILPKTKIDEAVIQGPFFFFDGPVQGGNDWQTQAFNLIRERKSAFTVAVPNNYKKDHPLYKFSERKGTNHYARSLSWENDCRTLALRLTQGCVLVYLPEENKSRPREDGMYAVETLVILGDCIAKLRNKRSLNIVVGAEPGFPGLDRIERNLREVSEGFRIYSSLQSTVSAALEKVSGR